MSNNLDNLRLSDDLVRNFTVWILYQRVKADAQDEGRRLPEIVLDRKGRFHLIYNKPTWATFLNDIFSKICVCIGIYRKQPAQLSEWKNRIRVALSDHSSVFGKIMSKVESVKENNGLKSRVKNFEDQNLRLIKINEDLQEIIAEMKDENVQLQQELQNCIKTLEELQSQRRRSASIDTNRQIADMSQDRDKGKEICHQQEEGLRGLVDDTKYSDQDSQAPRRATLVSITQEAITEEEHDSLLENP